ncbi:hypothetical protein SUGI_0030840 [Cryptomeria japonica]|nr:hypothetical protein SUGI_0030840 [Cryptomeria japonica]
MSVHTFLNPFYLIFYFVPDKLLPMHSNFGLNYVLYRLHSVRLRGAWNFEILVPGKLRSPEKEGLEIWILECYAPHLRSPGSWSASFVLPVNFFCLLFAFHI